MFDESALGIHTEEPHSGNLGGQETLTETPTGQVGTGDQIQGALELGVQANPSLSELLKKVASDQGLEIDPEKSPQIDTLVIYEGGPLTQQFVVGNRVVEMLKPEVYNGPFGMGDFSRAFAATSDQMGYEHGQLEDYNDYVIYPLDDDANAFARRLAWQVLAAEDGFVVFEPEDLDFLAMAQGLDFAESTEQYNDLNLTVYCTQDGVRLEMLNRHFMNDPSAVAAFKAVASERKMFFCSRANRLAVLYQESDMAETGTSFAEALSEKIAELNQE